jgi:hypothetical protein
MHKGFKCLDISTGRIYISRDVVFDEQVFPFSKLHTNAGAHLRYEIELLPPTLFDLSSFGSTTIHDPVVVNDSSNSASNAHKNLEANLVLEPVFHAVSQEDAGAAPQDDSLAPAASPAPIPEESTSGSPAGASEPAGNTGPSAAASGQSTHATRPPATTPPVPHVQAPDHTTTRQPPTGQSTPAAPHVQALDHAAATCQPPTGPGAPADPATASATPVAPGFGVSGGSGAPPPSADQHVVAPLQPEFRPRTRARYGIHKPKWYTDGTIRYGMTVSVEPTSIHDALTNDNWRKSMDVEYEALMKNKTWHLVPPHHGHNLIDCR